ncbi:MAG: hypothetical protein HOM27_02565 [Candidatus Marinimicrobia bacterium]|nr:hypothetical protein [Candidatus Neomarinimicrobiota bacterium]
MKKLLPIVFILSSLFANDIDFNAALSANYGDNYDFYSYSENRLDLNFFYNDLQGWIQYEYSNPPDVGFPINDIRKFRIEYALNDLTIKFGDIYEFWGRGLALNQIDDQITNFDNGTRGLFLSYSNGPLSLSHLNGNSSIWLFGTDLRTPFYNNSHNMSGNQFQYDWNSFSLGLTQLQSNETHQKLFGDKAFINHKLNGIYGSWMATNADFFFEYVDKVSTEKTDFFNEVAHDSLKEGHGVYGNLNLYLGNWGLSTEYKRYAFDRGHTDFTADDYGNRIELQMMPTLGKEQNSTLLGRVAHNYNLNDERGVQFEVNGSLLDKLTLTAQYSHLSRNNDWQSVTLADWEDSAISNYLPSSNPSSLPYWENYQEISGYGLGDKLYFKLGRGNNKEIIKAMRYFSGTQVNTILTEIWTKDTTDFYGYLIVDSTLTIDTSFSDPYNVEAKMWQEAKSFTIPMEINYSFNNNYTFGIGFQYQERTKNNITKGNSRTYSYSDSAWTLIKVNDPDSMVYSRDTQFLINEKKLKTQYNRMIYVTLSKAPTWSFTITHDWTNGFDGPTTVDPYYNPLEALIFGDLKYFTGERNRIEPPNFIQKRWVSAELAYNITSSQRVSIMYGSIQGGLFCSNGICRLIAPFNDGIKFSYSAIF